MQMVTIKKVSKQTKSPLNYIGGKGKLLPQILPFFPENINIFVDLFAGGLNVGLNVDNQILLFQLSLTNEEGYKKIRKHYNTHKNPLDLFVLIAFSFNHQIRFNNSHEFNNPFGRERSSFNDICEKI